MDRSTAGDPRSTSWECVMQCAKRSQRAPLSMKVLAEAWDTGGRIAPVSRRAPQDQLDHFRRAEDAELAGGEAEAAADDQPGVVQAMHPLAVAAGEIVVLDDRDAAGQANLAAVGVAGEHE